MKIIKVNELPSNTNPHGVEAKKAFESDKLTIMQLTLKPGDNISQHSSGMDVVFYILSGTGKSLINNDEAEVKENNIVFSPSGTLHGWVNNNSSDLKILAIKH